MEYCPSCGVRLEYQPDSCPACDRSLSDRVPSELPARNDEVAADGGDEPLVAIARFHNAAEAGFFAHTLLTADEIPVSLKAEDDFDAISGYWAVRYLLMVPEKMQAVATQALQSLVRRSATEDFQDDETERHDVTRFGSAAASAVRFDENPLEPVDDGSRMLNWGPVVLTLAAGSLALWGLHELNRGPVVQPIGKHRDVPWDEISRSPRPWVQELEGNRRREMRIDKRRNRAVIREFIDGKLVSERAFDLPAEAVQER